MDRETALQRSQGKPYAETFRCPGGQMSLDFCNSGQGARGDRKTEWLADFGDLVAWLRAAGALSDAQARQLARIAERTPKAAHDVWQRALRFREALFRVLEARAHGRAAERADVGVIEAEHARTAPFGRLAWDGDAYAWSLGASFERPDAALQPIVASAVVLLTSARLERVTECGNDTCSWLFIDETRNRSRRWCEMATCGNLLKVRRHRERARRERH